MGYPPRLAHLATRAIVVQKLVPTYGQAHHIDDEEARVRLDTALHGPLLEQVLDAAWSALKGNTKRLDDEGLLEKVARSLKERPFRPGKIAKVNPAWSAFLVLANVAANTASDAARRVLETEEGQKRIQIGMAAVGEFLAQELTRP